MKSKNASFSQTADEPEPSTSRGTHAEPPYGSSLISQANLK